jgi:hypothetical protein
MKTTTLLSKQIKKVETKIQALEGELADLNKAQAILSRKKASKRTRGPNKKKA